MVLTPFNATELLTYGRDPHPSLHVLPFASACYPSSSLLSPLSPGLLHSIADTSVSPSTHPRPGGISAGVVTLVETTRITAVILCLGVIITKGYLRHRNRRCRQLSPSFLSLRINAWLSAAILLHLVCQITAPHLPRADHSSPWASRFFFLVFKLSYLWFLVLGCTTAFKLCVLWLCPHPHLNQRYSRFYIVTSFSLALMASLPYFFVTNVYWSDVNASLVMSAAHPYIPVQALEYIMSIPVFIAYGVITIVAVVVGVSLVRQAYIRRTRPVPVSCWYPIVPPSTKPAYTCGVVHTSEKVLCNAIGIHVAHLWVCVLCQAVPVALLVMEYPWFNTSCSVKVITTIGPALQGLVSAILFLMNPTLYRYWDIRQEQLSSHHYDDVALGDFPPISSDPYHVAIPAPSNPFLAGPPPPSAEFKEDTSRSDLRRASWFSAAYTLIGTSSLDGEKRGSTWSPHPRPSSTHHPQTQAAWIPRAGGLRWFVWLRLFRSRNSNTNEPVRPSFTQWSFPTPHPTSTGVTSLPHSLARGAHLVGEPGLGAVVLFTTPISCPPIPAEDPQRPTIQH